MIARQINPSVLLEAGDKIGWKTSQREKLQESSSHKTANCQYLKLASLSSSREKQAPARPGSTRT